MLQAGATVLSGSLRTGAGGYGIGQCDGNRSSSGRDFCVAVSGGLASVLELVQPLQHIGWAGRDTSPMLAAVLHGIGKTREILRMARVPSAWWRAGAVVKAGQAFSSRPRGESYGEDFAGNGKHYCHAAAAETGTVSQDVDDGEGGFIVMCEDGWFGWYHSYHRRFEVNTVWLGAVARNELNRVLAKCPNM